MVTENTAPNAAADVEMSQYVADRTRVNEDKIKKDDEIISQFGDYNYGWHDSDAAGEAAKRGIDENVVRAISADKGEPQWMLDMRLRGFKAFLEKPMPDWGVDLSGFNADDFKYYVKPIDKQAKSWDELPDDIRNTYDRLGIPEAEKNRLVSGVAAQYESEVIYNSIQEDLKKQGVIFVDTDTAVREYPELVKKYFGTVVPPEDNKFGALNTAAWSGGSFVYVPKGVHVDIPLQAYFRINTPAMGQFERTLIIADEGSYVHYVEGCTAPIWSEDSLHAAIVEIIVEKHARVRYTTVQNWSNNVYNLVTQRAYVREGGTMEWVDGNIGSKATMKYPACILAEPYAKASTMSLGFAGKGQYQDTGAKMIHLAPHTSSTIVAKSISRGGGRSAYRGLVKIVKGAYGSSNSTVCDALLVDDFSRSDTYPHVDVREDDVSMAHEATVSKISEDQLFYLMSRGLTEEEARGMIVRGFVEPISRELPMEYALDPNDPYAIPAAMPSSVDHAVRSFNAGDYPEPSRKQDEWRYTPIERINEFFTVFKPSGETQIEVSMIDGSPLAEGVKLSQIKLGEGLSGTVSKPNDRVSAVEWESGRTATILELSGEIAQPVLVKVHGAGEDLDAFHLVIAAADKAHADVVVEHDGDARLAEGVEITTGKDSHVSTTFVQEWAKTAKHVANHRIHVGEGASLRHSVVTLGGDIVRIRMDQDFGGEQGDLNMLGIYFVDPGEYIEHRTMVVHNHPDCKSRVVYKGALDGKGAHSTWVGNALIQPTAPGTDSYELNRNLVLTPGAIADSEPNLEIENGNIIGAGHASSVGRFDDEELFYLESRGIPETDARKLVVRGFFGELVEEIGIPAISEHLMTVIDRRLARGENDAMAQVLEDK